MTQADKWTALLEAYGEQEADRLVVCEFGSIDALYEHALAIGIIA